MKELIIVIPEGFKIDTFDTNTGRVQFSALPKSPIGRITTFEEVCQAAGEDIADYTLSGNPTLRQIVSNQLNRVMLIVEVFNQGIELKMDESNQKNGVLGLTILQSRASGSTTRISRTRLRFRVPAHSFLLKIVKRQTTLAKLSFQNSNLFIFQNS